MRRPARRRAKRGIDVADDALGAGRDADAGDGASDDVGEQVAAYGFYFREFRHRVLNSRARLRDEHSQPVVSFSLIAS